MSLERNAQVVEWIGPTAAAWITTTTGIPAVLNAPLSAANHPGQVLPDN
ncbi:hypothetical protein ACFXNW_28945 [Nocardia sp. NPDC059180]